MKKFLSVILSAIMCMAIFTACGESGSESEENAYSGILTKVKLGMPLTKIVSMQPDGVDLYYEDDTTIWCINPDTDLMVDVSALVPEADAYYYCDDSIITYYFKTQKGDEEIYLEGYSEEVHCLIDRTSAEKYFNKKSEELTKKHCTVEGSAASSSVTGTEDIDMTLVYKTHISASSYTIDFTMTLTYSTVNGVDGYYATMYEIDFTEKETKDEVSIDSPSSDE